MTLWKISSKPSKTEPTSSSPRKIKGELQKETEFICDLLGIDPDITVITTDLHGFGGECHDHEDGSYTILLSSEWCNPRIPLAHELVHVKQYMTGELKCLDRENNLNQYLWKDTVYLIKDGMGDDYYLSPWEMEARALEDWIEYRWNNRDELHRTDN